jgi:hypothetical protein
MKENTYRKVQIASMATSVLALAIAVMALIAQ